MAHDDRLDIQVAFLTLAGAVASYDAGFATTVKWDVPVLEGYPWLHLPPRHRKDLRELLRTGRWDALVLYTGYRYRAFWSALFYAKRAGVPVLFGTDSSSFKTRTGAKAKVIVKRLVLPWIFRLADAALAPSSGSRSFLLGMGLRSERVALTPFVVDNEWWTLAAEAADAEAVRLRWEIPTAATLILFCAKLQAWKGPDELLAAFSMLEDDNVFLLFAGEGPLRHELEATAVTLGIAARVRFAGFANQTELPGIYKASDVFVLPSSYEPFGLVVNEAMLCGCPVIVSDQVGAAGDLVSNGATGIVYPSGDTQALASELQALVRHPEVRTRLASAARRRMAAWSPATHIDSLVAAIEGVSDQSERR
jgi:glycosyltransferase involved in cell wall biosynthesis